MRENVFLSADCAEQLDAVDRRGLHRGLPDGQRRRDGEIRRRAARIRRGQAADAAVRPVRRRVDRDGPGHGGRLNAVRDIRRGGHDQLLQAAAADLGRRAALVERHGLRAEAADDLPAAQRRVVGKVVQREPVDRRLLPAVRPRRVFVPGQTDADVRRRQDRDVDRLRLLPCGGRGVLEQADRADGKRDALPCGVVLQIGGQLERAIRRARAVSLRAVKFGVPQTLPLALRDKAQTGQHLSAVDRNSALVVQRAVVVRDRDLEAAFAVLAQRNAEGAVERAAVRPAVLEVAVGGAGIGVHAARPAVSGLDRLLELRAAVVKHIRLIRVRHIIDNAADDLPGGGLGHDAVPVDRGIGRGHVAIHAVLGRRERVDRSEGRPCHSGEQPMIEQAVAEHTRIRAAGFAACVAGRDAARSVLVGDAPGIVKVVVVSGLFRAQRIRAAAVHKDDLAVLLAGRDRKAVLDIGIRRGLRPAVGIAVAEDAGGEVVATERLRIVAAAVDVQRDVLGRVGDELLCPAVDRDIRHAVRREKADDAGGHGARIDLDARAVDAVRDIDRERLTLSGVGGVGRDIAEDAAAVVRAVVNAPSVPSVQTAVVLAAEDVEVLTGGGVIQLRHDAARRAYPVRLEGGLEIAVVIAALERAAVVRPLADDAARVVRQAAVDRSVVDAALDQPVGRRAVGLGADDAAGETVGVGVTELTADERPVEQEGEVFFALVHADDAAGADADAVRTVDEQPVSADAALERTGRRIAARDAAETAVARDDDLHGASLRDRFSARSIGQLLDVRAVLPFDPAAVRRQAFRVREQLAHLADIRHQGLGALIAGQGDRALVIAGHAADHAVFDRDRAGSGIVYVALLDDAGRIVLARDAADVRGQALLVGSRTGGGRGVHAVRRQRQRGDRISAQQTAVDAGDAAVAVRRGALSLGDRARIGAVFHLACRRAVGRGRAVLTDHAAEVLIAGKALEIRGDADRANRAARAVDADRAADLQSTRGNVVFRLLRDLGVRDRAAVVADERAEQEGAAGDRDPVSDFRAADRAALVVDRTDRARRRPAARGERYRRAVAADRAVLNAAEVFARDAAGVAVAAGDAAVAVTVLDRALPAADADDAARRARVRRDPTEVFREAQTSRRALLRTGDAACETGLGADLRRLTGQTAAARAAERAAVDAGDAADLAAAAHGQFAVRGDDVALCAAVRRAERAVHRIHADHAADAASGAGDAPRARLRARKHDLAAVFARDAADAACAADVRAAGAVLHLSAAEVEADDAADRSASGDGAVFPGRAVFERADVQTRDAADIILRCAAHAAGQRAVRNETLVQTDNAAHGVQTVHRAPAGAAVDHMVFTTHADDAADDGNAERIRARLIGQRLRRVLMALRAQIGREIDTGFQPAVREYAVRRTVEAARVQAADHLHPALRLAAADDAARIRIRADGHIAGNHRQFACTVAVRGDGDGVRIGGGRHSARHIVPVLRDARQESVQRFARPVLFRVGALIADQTAAERLCGDRAEAVVDPE